MPTEVPEEVHALLRERVAAYEHLEALLLLRRTRSQAWTPESVAKQLQVTPSFAAEVLDHLCRYNLIDVRVGGATLLFRYNPGTPNLDRAVGELERIYSDRPIHVMRLLSEYAVERVRTSAMRMFADAFVIKGRKKDG